MLGRKNDTMPAVDSKAPTPAQTQRDPRRAKATTDAKERKGMPPCEWAMVISAEAVPAVWSSRFKMKSHAVALGHGLADERCEVESRGFHAAIALR